MLKQSQLTHKITNNCREIKDKVLIQAGSISNLHIKEVVSAKNCN